jgi:gluconate 5-dehydrogenase
LKTSELFSLEHKVIVVTGGSGYLGSAAALGLLAMGAKVVVADRAECGHVSAWSNQAVWIHCDVSDTQSIQEMFRRSRETFGKIDGLVNMATYGAGYGPVGTVDRMTDDDWQIGIDGALGTVFRCTREVIPYLRENGGGSIVNFASMYGVVSPDPRIYGDSGANNPPNYGAGKAGVLQFTRYCAAHLAPDNIRVNSITPGPFPNPAQQANQNESFRRLQREKIMIGRVGTPQEIVGPVVLLLSDAASYMTGSDITIDGGWTAW